MLVAFVVLGLGGGAIEHFVGGFGVTSNATTKFLPSNANLTPISSLNSLSVDQFMDLKEIANATAPAFTLRTQRDHQWKLRRSDGKVIVLMFENAICNDLCPVLGNEVKQAQAFLGSDASKVEFALVNTDPRAIGVKAPARLRSRNPVCSLRPTSFFSPVRSRNSIQSGPATACGSKSASPRQK